MTDDDDMTLIEELEADVKEAMLARDGERRDALRLILSTCGRPKRICRGRFRRTRSSRCFSASASGEFEAAEAFRAGGREEQGSQGRC